MFLTLLTRETPLTRRGQKVTPIMKSWFLTKNWPFSPWNSLWCLFFTQINPVSIFNFFFIKKKLFSSSLRSLPCAVGRLLRPVFFEIGCEVGCSCYAWCQKHHFSLFKPMTTKFTRHRWMLCKANNPESQNNTNSHPRSSCGIVAWKNHADSQKYAVDECHKCVQVRIGKEMLAAGDI